ncbi:hypothetical protein ABW21_db0201667 [Orbilia brochopaga]|nr:hypothetical protein ABW21_db0201667 [Drechslerella brochopaga]
MSLSTASRFSESPSSPSFPSELPTPKSAGFRSLSLDESARTPISPPSAYLDFLKTSIVMRTPTSATFRDVPLPPTSAPISSGCTCRGRRSARPIGLRRSSADSNAHSSRESSCDSTGSTCCSNYCYFPPPTPYTPVTPSSLKTPLSGTKRLRIPPSPAFSPNYSASFESPFPIYAQATPRTPITEEDEEDLLESGILSASGDRIPKPSACRHRKVVTIRADSAGLNKASRMKLMAAPKGKKRRVD